MQEGGRMQVERMLTVKYAALQGAYWFLAAVGLAFVTPLLEGKGYSGLEIGPCFLFRFIFWVDTTAY